MSKIPILQPRLFEEIDTQSISIKDAARQVGVSTATIRNWIKTGYLIKTYKGHIEHISFQRFIDNVAGSQKLNSRANKSQKDSHNHDQLLAKIMNRLSNAGSSPESIANEYEETLSDSYRNKEGIYYTPGDIVDDLLSVDDRDLTSKTFCDPCCGSGNFIMRAVELGFQPENIYGFDIDPVAVALTKKRIFEKTGYISDTILEIDFLEYISRNPGLFFDYIFTNPPWGKKLLKKAKDTYAAAFKAGKSTDTSSLFFFAALSCLKENGILGFLLPEAFFNISTFENARVKSLNLCIKRLIDYGKSFRGLMTKAQAIVLCNTPPAVKDHQIQCKIKNGSFKRSASSFLCNPKSILNFHCKKEEAEVINHIFSIPHTTLTGKAKWGLGIVTGNNKKFCKNKAAKNHMPVYKGSDIKINGLEPPTCFIPNDLSLYQQVAPATLFEAPQKLIYKFISSKLCFFLDSEQHYILNSANMLIPADDFPISCGQLCELLNSNIMNWLFKNIFNTRKVLRGDIESLPIHIDYFDAYEYFTEETFLDFLNIEAQKTGTYGIKR